MAEKFDLSSESKYDYPPVMLELPFLAEYPHIYDISPTSDGGVLNSIDLSDIARVSYGGQTVLTDTKIFLAGDETQFTAVSKEGEFICTVNKPADKAYLVSGNNGNAYVAAPKGSESDVYKFNTESATLEKVFSTEFGNIFSGGGDNFRISG